MSHEANPGVTCDQFEARVNDLLDLRQSPQDDLELTRHASVCSPCQDLLAEYTAVDDSMKLLRHEVDRILGDPSRPSSRPGQRMRWVTALIVTAGILLVGLNLNWNAPQISDRELAQLAMGSHEMAGRLPAGVAPSGSAPVTNRFLPPAYSLFENGDEALRHFEGSLNDPLAAIQGSLPVNHPALDRWIRPFGSLEPMLRMSSEIPGWQPVRGTMTIAIDYLRRSLDGRGTRSDPDLGSQFPPARLLAAV